MFPVQPSNSDLLNILSKEHFKFHNKSLAAYTSVANVAVDATLASMSFMAFPGQNLYIEQFQLYSDKDITIELQAYPAQGLNSAAGIINETKSGRYFLKAGIAQYIDYYGVVPYGQVWYIINKGITDTTGNIIVRMYAEGYEIFQTLDFFAPKAIMGIGDSIMRAGTNISPSTSTPFNSYFGQVFKYFKDSTKSVKPIMKAFGGAAASDMIKAIRWGFVDVDNCSLCFIGLGTNDATSAADYGTNILEIVNHITNRFPLCKIILISPPKLDSAGEATMAEYRAELVTIVATLANPLVTYCNIGANLLTGVTPAQVHPNQTGHDEAATLILAHIAANSITI